MVWARDYQCESQGCVSGKAQPIMHGISRQGCVSGKVLAFLDKDLSVSVRAKGVCQERHSQSSSVYLMVIATRIYAMISLDAVTLAT